MGDIFLILCPSHNVLTLSSEHEKMSYLLSFLLREPKLTDLEQNHFIFYFESLKVWLRNN